MICCLDIAYRRVQFYHPDILESMYRKVESFVGGSLTLRILVNSPYHAKECLLAKAVWIYSCTPWKRPPRCVVTKRYGPSTSATCRSNVQLVKSTATSCLFIYYLFFLFHRAGAPSCCCLLPALALDLYSIRRGLKPSRH